ncbi:MAG: hypothetical protein C4346_14045 [Chloroflexota bacterium]
MPSPLDAFLRDFLEWLANCKHGMSPSRDLHLVAETFGWPAPFVEALITSASARHLIAQDDSRRGRVTWRLSERGKAWLAARQRSEATGDGEVAERSAPDATADERLDSLIGLSHLHARDLELQRKERP